jgi:hypothetical protein
MSDELKRDLLMVRRAFTMTDFETGPGEALDRLYKAASQNQALQERAEKAEAALHEIARWRYRSYTGGGGDGVDVPTREARIAIAALSPTQETDPE